MTHTLSNSFVHLLSLINKRVLALASTSWSFATWSFNKIQFLKFWPFLSECCIPHHQRHEDAASSCTETKIYSTEDGWDFRGTSQGTWLCKELLYIFISLNKLWAPCTTSVSCFILVWVKWASFVGFLLLIMHLIVHGSTHNNFYLLKVSPKLHDIFCSTEACRLG